MCGKNFVPFRVLVIIRCDSICNVLHCRFIINSVFYYHYYHLLLLTDTQNNPCFFFFFKFLFRPLGAFSNKQDNYWIWSLARPLPNRLKKA